MLLDVTFGVVITGYIYIFLKDRLVLNDLTALKPFEY